MTRLINLLEVISIADDEAVFFSKEQYTKEDLLIAQHDKSEQSYDIKELLKPPYLKNGYTMYILSKHNK